MKITAKIGSIKKNFTLCEKDQECTSKFPECEDCGPECQYKDAFRISTKQMNLVEEVCPRCMKPESEVEGKLHEDDGLCLKCEGEWVESYEEVLDDLSYLLSY